MRGGLRQAAQAALFLSTAAGVQTMSTASTSCPTVLTPSYPAPVVASGYQAQLIATGMSKPRGIILDKTGALLVVQQGKGIQRLGFTDHGGTCLVLASNTTLSNNTDLTHGIELSSDGKTLYASSANDVYSWTYNATAVTLSNQRTLVTNMSNDDHVSRTLLLSRKQPDTLLVSRGSGENMDMLAAQASSGRSQIRVFNVSSADQAYDYASQGRMLGWGLRNSVGVAEHPATGGVWSVENSADNLVRMGTDIHQDDPGEELNYHGPLDAPAATQGAHYGYPHCFALWSTDVPSLGHMTVGSQFALDQTATANDTLCNTEYIAPRLTFQAHTAPLDMKFSADGTVAYVSFHGSWNRDPPAGYKVSAVSFSADGDPTEPAHSTTAALDVLSNPDTTACPGRCFRPVGLALDAQGRVFMSSDATGDIYVLRRTATATTTGNGTGPASISSSPGRLFPRNEEWILVLTVALSVVGGAFFTWA